MNVDLQWLVGIGVTLSLGWASMLIGAFYKVLGMIRRVETKLEEGDAALHSRVTRVREDTVRKSDLTELSMRLSKDLHEIRDEQRNANSATNLRLDALLNAIANRNSSGGSQ